MGSSTLFPAEDKLCEKSDYHRWKMSLNLTLEELLTDLAERSDSEDILQFAQVFAIAKRGGGNLTEVICTTAAMIGRRIDAKQEIQTVLSGRKMEQMIMKLMPFGILLYIEIGRAHV